MARAVTEFWRRWHISLSSFFRDYLYIPLGGNRVKPARHLLNLFIVWALTGLWHGASWNFVLWGLYYFVFLVLEKSFLLRWLDKSRVLSHVYCLLAALFGWILFHFTDIRLGWTVFAGLFGANANPLSDFVTRTLLGNKIFLLLASALACTPLVSSLGKRLDLRFGEAKAWRILRDCLLPVALLLLSTCMLVGESYNPFLYFQF